MQNYDPPPPPISIKSKETCSATFVVAKLEEKRLARGFVGNKETRELGGKGWGEQRREGSEADGAVWYDFFYTSWQGGLCPRYACCISTSRQWSVPCHALNINKSTPIGA